MVAVPPAVPLLILAVPPIATRPGPGTLPSLLASALTERLPASVVVPRSKRNAAVPPVTVPLPLAKASSVTGPPIDMLPATEVRLASPASATLPRAVASRLRRAGDGQVTGRDGGGSTGVFVESKIDARRAAKGIAGGARPVDRSGIRDCRQAGKRDSAGTAIDIVRRDDDPSATAPRHAAGTIAAAVATASTQAESRRAHTVASPMNNAAPPSIGDPPVTATANAAIDGDGSAIAAPGSPCRRGRQRPRHWQGNAIGRGDPVSGPVPVPLLIVPK